jgi:hypothetical protein
MNKIQTRETQKRDLIATDTIFSKTLQRINHPNVTQGLQHSGSPHQEVSSGLPQSATRSHLTKAIQSESKGRAINCFKWKLSTRGD